MKKVKAKGGYCTVDSKKPCKNNDSIKKKKIGVIRVDPTQRNTYFTISKLPKTQAHTTSTSQLHKTSVVESTYTAVLRISVKD